MIGQDLTKSTIFLFNSGTLTLPAPDFSDSAQTKFDSGAIIDGKYRVLNLLGTGGMGAVYRVQHLLLGNEVALKTFQRMELSEEELLRFEREAKALANLTHKHLVKVFDYGLHNGVPYYTMEYLEGESLAECLARDVSLSLLLTVKIFVQVAQALKYIHAKNIVHRDLKPGNIFLQRLPQRQVLNNDIAYEVRLVDFGIASISSLEENQKLTNSGRVIGSPLYMSPEQGLGMPVGSAADNYSLGCSIFATLTGSPPFCGESALATILLHQKAAPPRLGTISGVTYPERLEALVAKLLVKDPQKRLADLDLFAEELLSVSAAAVSVATNAKVKSDKPERLKTQTNLDVVSDASQPKRNLKIIILAATIMLLVAVGASLLFKAKNTVIIKKHQIVDTIPAVRQNDQPYLYPSLFRIAMEGGQPFVYANFPESGEIGEYSFDINHYQEAIGPKKWAASQAIYFTPSQKFLSDLRNLDQFAQLNLIGLSFSNLPGEVKNAQLFEHLSRFSKLQYIDLKNGDYGDRDILSLRQLPHLTELRVANSHVTGAGLTRLAMLKNFDSLDFSGCNNASPMLDVFHSPSRLDSLRLDFVRLQPTDWQRIAAINKLNILSLNNTQMTDSQLRTLAKMKYVGTLHARNAAVTDACYPTILLMKDNGLRKMELSSRFLSQLGCQRLQALFPRGMFYQDDSTLPITPDAAKYASKEVNSIGDLRP